MVAVRPDSARRCSGSVMYRMNGSYTMNPSTAPTTVAAADLNSRLRNSRRCSLRAIWAWGLCRRDVTLRRSRRDGRAARAGVSESVLDMGPCLLCRAAHPGCRSVLVMHTGPSRAARPRDL